MFNNIQNLGGKPLKAKYDSDGNVIKDTYLKKSALIPAIKSKYNGYTNIINADGTAQRVLDDPNAYPDGQEHWGEFQDAVVFQSDLEKTYVKKPLYDLGSLDHTPSYYIWSERNGYEGTWSEYYDISVNRNNEDIDSDIYAYGALELGTYYPGNEIDPITRDMKIKIAGVKPKTGHSYGAVEFTTDSNNKITKLNGIDLAFPDVSVYAKSSELSNYALASNVVKSDWNATSGNAQILNKPDLTKYALASNVVKSDWNATSGNAQILNKPDLSKYALASNVVKSDWDATTGNAVILNKPDLSKYALKSELSVIDGTIEDPQQGGTVYHNITDISFKVKAGQTEGQMTLLSVSAGEYNQSFAMLPQTNTSGVPYFNYMGYGSTRYMEYVDVYTKAEADKTFALDSNLVHKTDNETIAGEKTFTDKLYVIKDGAESDVIVGKSSYAIWLCSETGGNRGIWVPSTSSGPAKYALVVDKNNKVTLNGTADRANALNITHGNEVNFTNVGSGYNNIWFNYRDGEKDPTDATTSTHTYDTYNFGNGKAGTSGVTLKADKFSGLAAKATADGVGNTITSTYATIASLPSMFVGFEGGNTAYNSQATLKTTSELVYAYPKSRVWTAVVARGSSTYDSHNLGTDGNYVSAPIFRLQTTQGISIIAVLSFLICLDTTSGLHNILKLQNAGEFKGMSVPSVFGSCAVLKGGYASSSVPGTYTHENVARLQMIGGKLGTDANAGQLVANINASYYRKIIFQGQIVVPLVKV